MKRALFNKEMRSLRPFLFVIVVLLLLDVVDAFLSPLHERSLAARLGDVSDQLAFFQIVLGFALGSNLLVREIDDGTLNFLDGLPMTRSAIFAAKIKAAMAVLLIYPAGLLLLNAALHPAMRESLDGALHPLLLLTFFALSVLVTLVGLTAGLLLGFLRFLSWLVLVLCVVGVKLLEDSSPVLAAALDTGDLLTLQFTGTHWQLPFVTMWTQIGLTLFFGAMAYILFRSAGSVVAQLQRFQARRRVLLVPVVALMLIASFAGLLMLTARKQEKSGDKHSKRVDAVEFLPIAAGNTTTRHYTFSYPALGGERIKPLIARADETFTRVAALLQVDGGAPIDVDLSGTTDNHEGTAYLDRIRMNARGAKAVPTLAHETAHVFALRLAGGEQARQLGGMTVFHEGLAEWVEDKFKDGERARQRNELVAAIVSARRLVTPRQLTDHATFSALVDENLKYPLGAILIERFVARYGETAPRKLLLTLARDDFPRDLDGYALWQTAFQLAGFDLDLVLDDYARHLKQLEPEYATQIAALPRARGSLVDQGRGRAVALRMDQALPAGTFLLVRFRPGMSSRSEQYRISFAALSPAGHYTAEVPARMVTRDEVCFQPGLMYAGVIIYEPWVCLPADGKPRF